MPRLFTFFSSSGCAVIAWGVTINFHKNYLVTNRPKPQIMKVIVQKPIN